ncbi:MAG: hypothetical protein E6R04_11610 [Spirochaetes bacterium]|nr:MAG: hypothetical protein E6R04_11610 [Spirochaetota bacterium]
MNSLKQKVKFFLEGGIDKVYSGTDFYVDPLDGDDDASGNSYCPLKTLQEVADRMHRKTIVGEVNIFLRSSTTESVYLFADLPYLTFVNIIGERTRLAGGVITGFSNFNPVTKQECTLTDSNFSEDFASYEDMLIVLESGPHQGAAAFIHKGAFNSTTVSPFYKKNPSSVIVPSVGDKYCIYSLPEINGRVMGSSEIGFVSLENLKVVGVDDYVDPIEWKGGSICARYCHIVGGDNHIFVEQGADGYFFGCLLAAHVRAYNAGRIYLGACLIDGNSTSPTADGAGSEVVVLMPCVAHGINNHLGARNRGMVRIDTNGSYFVVGQNYGLVASSETFVELRGKLFGRDIQTCGVVIGSGAAVHYAINCVPDLVKDPQTGTMPTKQVDVGGITKNYSDFTSAAGCINQNNLSRMIPLY